MDETGNNRRRPGPDGSLETDHYRGIAHRLRSATARRWLQDLVDVLRRRRANAGTGGPAGSRRA